MGRKDRDFSYDGIGMNCCKIKSSDLVISDEILSHRESWIDLSFVFSIKTFQTSLEKMVSIINVSHDTTHGRDLTFSKKKSSIHYLKNSRKEGPSYFPPIFLYENPFALEKGNSLNEYLIYSPPTLNNIGDNNFSCYL